MLREKTGRKDDKFRLWLFLVLTAVCLVSGVGAFFSSAPMKEKLFGPEGRQMLGETLLIFAGQLFFFCPPKWFLHKLPRGRERVVRAAGVFFWLGLGLWCHQILVPFLVAGCWLAGLLLFGDVIFRHSVLNKKMDSVYFRLLADFLMGSGCWICLVCVLSAFRIGGVGRMRGIAAVLVLAAALETGIEMRGRVINRGRAGKRAEEPKGAEGFNDAGKFLKEAGSFNGAERFLKKAGSFNGAERFLKKAGSFNGVERFLKKAGSFNRAEKFFLAVILTMVFVQLARINLMPDYDSLHYGLRSHYILDAGHGIYEDLGNIHLVYTYSKGWEVLTFPLSGTITYGFQLCFNLWMAVLVVVLCTGLVFRISRRRTTGLFCGMLISLIPGIMNMGITAKSDLLTLVCQLCILWAAVEIFKTSQAEEKSGWFGIALGACLFSFALKPTSLVFSSLLALGCLGTLVLGGGFLPETERTRDEGKPEGRKRAGKKQEEKQADGRLKSVFSLSVLLMPAVPCAGALAGMWIRTWRMTGVFTTSVFTSIWEKMGFSVKWPYAFSSIPNEGMQMGVWEGISFLLKRLFGVLFAPTGDDMFHVRLAWGSSIVFLGLAAWVFWGMGREKEKRCLKVSIIVLGLFNLLSLYLLWQVDGNYYMLFYVLAAMAGSFSLENAGFWGQEDNESRNRERKDSGYRNRNREQEDSGCRKQERSCGMAYLVPLVFAGFVLIQTGLILGTNWAGTKGFTPIKFLHGGVVNHQQERYAEKCASGNQQIWQILSQNPETRVIAAGEHPMVLQFPCNVQSYYDVTGSGGNVRLVKTLEDFKAFLRFAKTEYIYVEAGYLEEGSRVYDVVRYLIEEGSLVQLYFEEGNMLGKVNLDGKLPSDPKGEAEAFYRQIGMKVFSLLQ